MIKLNSLNFAKVLNILRFVISPKMQNLVGDNQFVHVFLWKRYFYEFIATIYVRIYIYFCTLRLNGKL